MTDSDMKNKDESYWKEKLTPEQYHVLREAGTERPFTGELLKNKDTGMYVCAACGQPLFSSDAKFESGSGWPSFNDVVEHGNVEFKDDFSHNMHRIEVKCANCGSHLGHVFPSVQTGKPTPYYCINSCALNFEKKGGSEEEAK